MRDRHKAPQAVRRRATQLAALLTAVVGVAVILAGNSADAAGSAPGAGSYVAIGDSFAAGPVLQPQVSGQPSNCDQSQANYPHLSAAALGLHLADMSCSGATTASVEATQLGALHPDTTVVSVTIGANDIQCFALCLRMPGTLQSRISSAAATEWGPLLDRIHATVPAARIYLVGYGTYLPSSGCPGVFPPPGLQSLIDGVDTTLRMTASAHGATYVDVQAASVGHTACTPEGTRWFEPGFSQSDAAPWHPTHAGMAGIAALLVNQIRATGRVAG
jgi:lysophospholipase L1-like esterase